MNNKRSVGRTVAFIIAATSASFLTATPATSAPEPRPTRAETTSGSGCLVKDANGIYHSDPSCTYHQVVQLDSAGNLIMLRYQDQGRLPPGAPAPSRAQTVSSTANLGGGLTCNVSEVTTPSGQYRSDCVYMR